jgi:hypothetical protein
VTNDNTTPWVLQYRASVSDTPTPALDQAILSAAGRASAYRRTARHFKTAALIGAFALFGLGTVWHVSQPGFDPRPITTEYGRFEGVSRRYLLEVETPRFAGFGITEGMP